MKTEYIEKIKETEVNMIKVTTKPEESIDLKTSKLSGVPYWPKGMEYPYMNGNPMKLAWQINFEELQTYECNLELPKTGILQFFINYNDRYIGMTFNETPYNIKTVFHEDIHLEQAKFNNEINNVIFDNEELPWTEELKLNFNNSKECLGLSDELTSDNVYKFKEELEDEDYDFMYEEYENSGSKIGGYAYFTQSDPRCYLEDKKDYVLLFQLDTDDNLMWGDSGVGNWFISLQDLKNKNFNNLFYNWDCC